MHRFVQRYWEVRVKVFPRSVAILASFFLFGFLFAQTAKTQQAANSIDPKTYGGMKWRLIGPFRGGRALAVTGVTSQPNTYYFGAVAGGIWKTTDDHDLVGFVMYSSRRPDVGSDRFAKVL